MSTPTGALMLTIDDMCDLFGLETEEQFWGRNIHNCECHSKGDEIRYNGEWATAEEDYTCESCSFEYGSKVVLFFTKTLLEHYELQATPTDEHEHTFTFEPTVSWESSAQLLLETINGYGPFFLNTLEDAILECSCTDAQDFVQKHAGHFKHFFEVYEGSKAENVFERKYFR